MTDIIRKDGIIIITIENPTRFENELINEFEKVFANMHVVGDDFCINIVKVHRALVQPEMFRDFAVDAAESA